MAPLPEDDGRKPGDQQAWTSEQRHAFTRYVDERARDAVEAYTTLPEKLTPDKQRARYAALKAARDRDLVLSSHTLPFGSGNSSGSKRPAPARRPLGGSRSTTGVWTSTGRNSSGTPQVYPTR